MEFQEYINETKEIYEALLKYIDNENDCEENFSSLINLFNTKNIREDHKKLQEVLQIVVSILNNHHRKPDFLDKVKQILLNLKENIKQTYSNDELFTIFQNSKIMFYFLLENETIELDKSLSFKMIQKKDKYFCSFFMTELEKYKSNHGGSSEYEVFKLEQQLGIDIQDENFDSDFTSKRKICENDSYICKLIREDLIDDFVTHVTQKLISPSSNIKPSIFETNPFLIDKETSLIEYASFFGSYQIFKYLELSNAELKPSLWLYTIHGNNSEIIHRLEELHIEPNDKTFTECFVEAIKCHHNNMAVYIKNNLMNLDINNDDVNQNNFDKNDVAYGFRFFNYDFVKNNLKLQSIFLFACYYNHLKIVDILSKNNEVDINEKMIFNYFKLIKSFIIKK